MSLLLCELADITGDMKSTSRTPLVLVLALAAMTPSTSLRGDEPGQTPAAQIAVKAWSPTAAGHYLDDRAKTWFAFASAERGTGDSKISCLSCHSLLPFALARPALRKLSGETRPTAFEDKVLEQVSRRVEHWSELDTAAFRLYYDFSARKKKESWGTEAVLNALVLAFDDRLNDRKEASDVTKKALAHLWQAQLTEGSQAGSWDWLDFGLEPWETKEAQYFGATLAALAVGSTPGYLAPRVDGKLVKRVDLLREYLRGNLAKQSLYNRIWLLAANARLESLLTKPQETALIDEIFARQHTDGGWRLSSLGPQNLSGDEQAHANSDGYATGLVLYVMKLAGTTRNDPRVRKGLDWLRAQQTNTGEWRAFSVNKKRDPESHVGKFMSDAATAFAVLALSD